MTVKRQQIAKEAAKAAATATYQAVLNTPMRKVATVVGVQVVAPASKDIARIAATAAYKSIMALGQATPTLETPPAEPMGTPPAGISPNRPTTGKGVGFKNSYPSCAQAYDLYITNEQIPDNVLAACTAEWNSGGREWIQQNEPEAFNGLSTFLK